MIEIIYNPLGQKFVLLLAQKFVLLLAQYCMYIYDTKWRGRRACVFFFPFIGKWHGRGLLIFLMLVAPNRAQTRILPLDGTPISNCALSCRLPHCSFIIPCILLSGKMR